MRKEKEWKTLFFEVVSCCSKGTQPQITIKVEKVHKNEKDDEVVFYFFLQT
ncbi:hypothetical protein B4088_2752 [Bacillus cereus]|uniref:Uncharacterized protein n=1 Tax=Bacillus cereus TaxID=1396 RepID=A0A164NYE9_BACCE|nr:hypothetical protein B4088_2752 [Bacillus cereus]